jgi:regulatory protein
MSDGKRRKPMEPPQPTGDVAAAREAGISLLARRDFASGELRAKLEKRGYPGPVVAAAVAELLEERVLNDARYAENYVSYHAERGRGPVRIAADLKALGLPRELVEASLAAGPDWRALAREARLRKFGPDAPPDWPEKARQARFLQYRGFSSDHIRSALGADFDLD